MRRSRRKQPTQRVVPEPKRLCRPKARLSDVAELGTGDSVIRVAVAWEYVGQNPQSRDWDQSRAAGGICGGG